ncbi:DMT family transporter [Nesterenkonia lutea]|uniref:Drug/metabolite transporter (DMT)-like permease n=1 Tax=Nesterenkonia lutea TaxID=272919 RepID=A0ABR9JFV9_9MICC|nr:DMT family transporter [Nesterenkonia lutea]MBE1524822.1 drug/metabolite transporter (DMT)-like permease [Nesterenkonia lutea]
MTPARGVVLMVLGTLAMASSAAMISAIDGEPLSVAAWRCLLAVPMLLPMAAWELLRRTGQAGPSRRMLMGALIAGVALGVDYSFYNTSIAMIGPGIATVLINVQIVILPLLAWMLEGVRPMRQLALIIPLMLAGVALTAGAMDLENLQLAGVLAGLAAGTGYALYLAIIRRSAQESRDSRDRRGAGREHRSAPFTVLSLVCLSAGATTALTATGLGRLQVPEGLEGWGAMLALAFVGQVLTYLCFNIAMTSISETASSTLMLLSAVFAVALAAVIFADIPSAWQLLGCAMIIGGAWWTAAAARRRAGRVIAPTLPAGDSAKSTLDPQR